MVLVKDIDALGKEFEANLRYLVTVFDAQPRRGDIFVRLASALI